MGRDYRRRAESCYNDYHSGRSIEDRSGNNEETCKREVASALNGEGRAT